MGLYDHFHHISFRKEDFRVSFLQPFCLIFLSALCVSEVFFLLSGNNSHQVLFVILPCVVTVLCVMAVLLLRSSCKFGLGPEGISCRDFWRSSQNATWEDVDDIRLVRTAGLEYLQVFVRGRIAPIWLPLFVCRRKTLRQMFMTYTHGSLKLHEKLMKIWSQDA